MLIDGYPDEAIQETFIFKLYILISFSKGVLLIIFPSYSHKIMIPINTHLLDWNLETEWSISSLGNKYATLDAFWQN